MTWNIGGVVLPQAPSNTRFRKSSYTKEIQNPGGQSWIIQFGVEPDSLRLEGTIAEAGKTKSFLNTNYIDTIEALLDTEINIGSPGARYADASWIMTGFEYSEVSGYSQMYEYSMEFRRGSKHIDI